MLLIFFSFFSFPFFSFWFAWFFFVLNFSLILLILSIYCYFSLLIKLFIIFILNKKKLPFVFSSNELHCYFLIFFLHKKLGVSWFLMHLKFLIIFQFKKKNIWLFFFGFCRKKNGFQWEKRCTCVIIMWINVSVNPFRWVRVRLTLFLLMCYFDRFCTCIVKLFIDYL